MKKKIGKALVVGAGISGVRSALDLAESGYGVTLIDRSEHMGGILAQLDYQFPTNHCGMCRMLPLSERDAGSQYCLRKGLFHENIELMLSTEITSVQGEVGNYQVALSTKPSYIDPDLCIGCGECTTVCPVEVRDDFNAGLSLRKAVYLPVPHSIPNFYVVDIQACTHCGKCEDACPTNAVKLSGRISEDFRILVVDDEMIVRDSIKEWLADEGFKVQAASSGRQALDMLGEQTFNLMLLDIKMPEMDGIEVIAQAKELYHDLNVVMMTAYATVETAVEAMKIGALDYLVKPFDHDALMPMVYKVYEDVKAGLDLQLNVGSIVLCGGTSYHVPDAVANRYEYGRNPNVLTNLEFERILSGSGPSNGRLLRPSDGKPVKNIAWLQCVGSRDIQQGKDYCSSICCMFAIKEAMLALEKTKGEINAVIHYMDMRTSGKQHQHYRDQAELAGVGFKRGRVHSVVPDLETGGLIIRSSDESCSVYEKSYDLVVLSVGQKPADKTECLAEMLKLPLNEYGFCETSPFSISGLSKKGISIGGSFSGLKDIRDSIIQAGSAALNASLAVHSSGGGLAVETESEHNQPWRDVFRDPAHTMVSVCKCDQALSSILDDDNLAGELKKSGGIDRIVFIDKMCTGPGWEELIRAAESGRENRMLIAACLPLVYSGKLRELSRKTSLNSKLVRGVDIRTAMFPEPDGNEGFAAENIKSLIAMEAARLNRIDPAPQPTMENTRRALVVGGGIAGMIAALSIADHGFEADLIEHRERLGGNLNWLSSTLSGESPRELLEDALNRIEKHPLVNVYTCAEIMNVHGRVGRFLTTVRHDDGKIHNLKHGVVILATGGAEYKPESYSYGSSPAIMTQAELEEKTASGVIDAGELSAVVMIQCVESREEPRNYCSRVCCLGSLKHALMLKEQNPDLPVFILYRDMMTTGFNESYYTRARKKGVIFIQYDKDSKPVVEPSEGKALVRVMEPLLKRELEIEADLVVLASGIKPMLNEELAAGLGIELDRDNFFKEADEKWRPVDSMKEGVFACGLSLSPGSIADSIGTAQAAASRALKLLGREKLVGGSVTAEVRTSLCSLCERCIEACPYDARFLDVDLEKVVVNPVMCQGCGSCAAVCPNSASVLHGYSDHQMFDIIDAAMESVRL